MADLTVRQMELAEQQREEWARLVHRAEAQGVSIEAVWPDAVQLSEADFRDLLAKVEDVEFEERRS